MKTSERVSNSCFCGSMVKISGNVSPKTNKGFLRRTLEFEATLLGSVHRRDKRRSLYGTTGRRCHRRPIVRWVEKVPSPSQPLNS